MPRPSPFGSGLPQLLLSAASCNTRLKRTVSRGPAVLGNGIFHETAVELRKAKYQGIDARRVSQFVHIAFHHETDGGRFNRPPPYSTVELLKLIRTNLTTQAAISVLLGLFGFPF
jgi:hypothetical protein